jgi:hypothetical protein
MLHLPKTGQSSLHAAAKKKGSPTTVPFLVATDEILDGARRGVGRTRAPAKNSLAAAKLQRRAARRRRPHSRRGTTVFSSSRALASAGCCSAAARERRGRRKK